MTAGFIFPVATAGGVGCSTSSWDSKVTSAASMTGKPAGKSTEVKTRPRTSGFRDPMLALLLQERSQTRYVFPSGAGERYPVINQRFFCVSHSTISDAGVDRTRKKIAIREYSGLR